MKILITGSAGFIGFHLTRKLIDEGHEVVGLDNLNSYYDVRLKLARLKVLGIHKKSISWGKIIGSSSYLNFTFVKVGLEDKPDLFQLFETQKFDVVYNLAAQAGVRHSIENPELYIASNVVGFANLLEACRRFAIKHLIYASSSSVYGLNSDIPFKVSEKTDCPISVYAATKKSNELLAHTYSHLFKLPTTGLRFFTVYGPWGRPDMATMLFAKAIMGGQSIEVFNSGKMSRDFTYVDDICTGLVKVMTRLTNGDLYRIYNIGNSKPVNLLEFIQTMEKALGREVEKIFMPMQPGDMEHTYADVTDLMHDFGYQPNTPLITGIEEFASWYLKYYHSSANELNS